MPTSAEAAQRHGPPLRLRQRLQKPMCWKICCCCALNSRKRTESTLRRRYTHRKPNRMLLERPFLAKETRVPKSFSFRTEKSALHSKPEAGSPASAFLGTGDFFGETILLGETYRNVTAEAAEDCELMAMDRETFLSLASNDLAKVIIVNLVKKLRELYVSPRELRTRGYAFSINLRSSVFPKPSILAERRRHQLIGIKVIFQTGGFR